MLTPHNQIQPRLTGSCFLSLAPFLLHQDSVPACPHARYRTRNELSVRRPGEATGNRWVWNWKIAEHLGLPVGVQERNKDQGVTPVNTDRRGAVRVLGSIRQLLLSPKAVLLFRPAPATVPVLLSAPVTMG